YSRERRIRAFATAAVSLLADQATQDRDPGGRRPLYRQSARRRVGDRATLRVACAGHCFNLDEELLFHQAVDDEQGVRRVERAAEELGKQRRSQRHEALDVLRVHEIGGELHDIVEAEAKAREHRAQVVEHLSALPVETALADDAAGMIERTLAGDEIPRPGLDQRHMRIEALRRPRGLGVDVLHELRHALLRSSERAAGCGGPAELSMARPWHAT